VSLALRAPGLTGSSKATTRSRWRPGSSTTFRELAISYLDRGDLARVQSGDRLPDAVGKGEAESTLGDPGDEHRLEAARSILKITREMKGCTAAIMRMWRSTDRARLPVRPHGLAQSNTA
jgi:hypothetical protein